MKKILALALAIVLVFALAACGGGGTTTDTGSGGNSSSPPPSSSDTSSQEPASPSGDAAGGVELALITDLGTIDDRSFNQGAWEGLVKYATENNITHQYYKPADQGDDAYLNAIDLAVQGGAKVIVTPGYLFEVPIFIAQDRYPNVNFILLDAEPFNGNWDAPVWNTSSNTVAVLYAEEQSGFLAGYAAVKDGYRRLGFMGGMAVPAVIRFGHGYIQGAEYAAQELALPAGAITLNYFYTGTFEPSPDIATRAAAWYNEGVEVIFACGGGICFSIFPAAEQSGNVVIGVDVDQSNESATVITSAMKELSVSVYDCLTDYYSGNFKGGETLIFSARNNGIGLPMASSKFNTFSQADYDAIFAKLHDGAIVVDNDTEIEPNAIPTSAVAVNYIF